MSCSHWLCERRVATLRARLGLPVIAARRCTETLILADGLQLKYDFKTDTVIGPHPSPFRYSTTVSAGEGFIQTAREDREGVTFGRHFRPEGTE